MCDGLAAAAVEEEEEQEDGGWVEGGVARESRLYERPVRWEKCVIHSLARYLGGRLSPAPSPRCFPAGDRAKAEPRRSNDTCTDRGGRLDLD